MDFDSECDLESEMQEILAVDREIEERFGLKRHDLLITYNTTTGDLEPHLPEGSSIAEAERRLGFVTKKFEMKYDYHGARTYEDDRGPIYPFQDFKDHKIFSVLATKPNVQSLYFFLQDRDDYRAARKLKRMYSEFFPQVSMVRRFLRLIRWRS